MYPQSRDTRIDLIGCAKSNHLKWTEKFSKNSSLYSNKNRNYILLLPYHIKISRDLHIFFFFVFGWVMFLTAICHVFTI